MSEQSGKKATEKIYKFLFLLYAPFAILSILWKTKDYLTTKIMYWTHIFFLVMIILVGLFILLSYYTKHKKQISIDHQMYLPRQLRVTFIIPYVLATVIFSIVGITLLTNKAVIKKYYHDIPELAHMDELSKGSEDKITLILPFTNPLGDTIETGRSNLIGLIYYLYKNPEISLDYHFGLIDSKGTYDHTLEDKIVAEIKNGSKYFIASLSRIGVPLSKNWTQIVSRAQTGGPPPILIVTDAASLKVETKKGSVYRHFIRLEDDINILINNALQENVNTAAFIASDDDVGRDAVQLFIEKWNERGKAMLNGVYLHPNLSRQSIIEELKISPVTKNKVDVLFVAHRDMALDEIINFVVESNLKSSIVLFPNTIVTNHLSPNQKEMLSTVNYMRSFPSYKNRKGIFKNTSINFIYFTLSKVVDANETMKDSDTLTFNTPFMKTKVPINLDFTTSEDADFNIKMRIDKRFVKKQRK